MSTQPISLTPMELVERHRLKEATCVGGSACFYGHWFGRPMDNFHEIETVTFDNKKDTLQFTFSEGETLTIQAPKDINEEGQALRITTADKVLWEWFCYGKPRTVENRMCIEITRNGSELNGKSSGGRTQDDFSDLNISEPAVSIA